MTPEQQAMLNDIARRLIAAWQLENKKAADGKERQRRNEQTNNKRKGSTWN